VANMWKDGYLLTICFHVDDAKISHKLTKVVDWIIEKLRQDFETIFEDGSGKMKVNRGKEHDFLGMHLDFSKPKKVKVTQFQYLEGVVESFKKIEPSPKNQSKKTSAAPEDLFKIDEDCEKLDKRKKEQFHNIVAKMLYATKRARPDTCTAVAFLTTRVRDPDKDDWRKMCHLMGYIRHTLYMPLTLSADGSGIIKWWVDGSFAVHPNMRGHTGGGVSLGRGFPIVVCTKHKLNTRSSTEAELVAVDDCMPAICWTRYFLKEQGYDVTDNILFQDNKSAILLEKNGKASSSKRTKHINIRYFFVSDRVAKGELKVEWISTKKMVGDYMTKPLQGRLFKEFRDTIMGVTSSKKDYSIKP
jgi:hypothetical protein